ncbi:MAG: aminotransferase class I/II-fold pyridoxal phosphate-dependent enzyme [Candidatus Eisenbacteria bacterium]|uniref:Aminotransferase class I/II-fold pyridoxal phosphate-dependent enzyme n=1 Tax=Eiseniibacteriota bacterium TaxID=2212470 RepID=A0A948W8E3_UNCEI|nr:aminotransferase class I/II-fold pyridoxal phosphate-dependent enzyme [Candidatus Eisenbacteria bacterium]MBU1950180.1 aminotransferase class I/II-fold pyridoxal phosphate-dependent enzyme [Candidatus Eisenbacteria bacterium]MBU2692606.1 aminotransferase class I/II-fold pyridoxal phosphate-dependent enzyme [Candidatus Eisenbacteria bacterium]
MEDPKMRSMDTQCVHAGHHHDACGAVIPPIYQTSTFLFKNVDHGASLFAGEEKGYIYTRMGNPTIESMEKTVAALEGGFAALGCGSGMAAIHTAFASMLNAGDHIVCSDAVYGPTNTLVKTVLSRFGITATFVDTSDTNAVREAMKPETKVIYVETPGNPTLVVADLKAVVEIAHAKGARVVVDNTFSSPILQQPLKFGVDVVVHSMTKYLNGHADVVAGIIVVKNKEDYTHFRKTLNQLGGTITPFNSFLVARGIKTLALRMERHCINGMKVAKYLEAHAKTEWVRYPYLPSHPQYEVAKRQMKGGGGVVSFGLLGGLEAGKTLMNSVKLCTLAVSLGGVETLIEHPASMTHATLGPEARRQANITDGLVRIAVGIEDVDEIIADLDQGLAKI